MKILIWPDPILKQVSEAVTEPLNPEYLRAMFLTMKGAGGVGLSAIQVGLAKRFFIMHPYEHDNGFGTVCVNPIIKTYSGEQKLMLEGCLSLPGQFESIKRFTEVEVAYWDMNLTAEKTEILSGQLAHIFQHEYEHLDGKLFVDRLPAARRSLVRGNLQKMKKWGKL